MFGLSSLFVELLQGPAERTWNCVSNLSNFLWIKFAQTSAETMPRSRRRHHSRSRSRSHSHDKDRETKRRKVESLDSPHIKRSVSADDECDDSSSSMNAQELVEQQLESPRDAAAKIDLSVTPKVILTRIDEPPPGGPTVVDLTATPKRTLTPKQLQRRLESEKKRQLKQQERDELQRKKHEEKEKLRLEKLKAKQEKDEERAKEKGEKEEQKRREREDKESKRKEREERDELKRREREVERQRKQQELDEKNREKMKQHEQKQKASAAFLNFFVKKESTKQEEVKNAAAFMSFQVKSDMRLPPSRRPPLTPDERRSLGEALATQQSGETYLSGLKQGQRARSCGRTWPFDDDVLVIDEEFGTSICEEKPRTVRMKAKFLKFHENKRPAYHGTWRKTTRIVTARNPFAEDKQFFDYEVESDDDWEEEEEQGESLNGSDDEEKEEEEDYEVDNEFFVPHGHLSDDELDDEATAKLSPESQKQKLKLLKDEFDEDMKTQTQRMKPRSIGCVWFNKDGSNVEAAIEQFLRPFAMLASAKIVIRERGEALKSAVKGAAGGKELPAELVPVFVKFLHGNTTKKASIINEFVVYMENNGFGGQVSKALLKKKMKELAQWRKCQEQGSVLFNKLCWCVEEDVKRKYNVQ